MTPILEDQPLSYAYDRPQYYRNAARENAWGEEVYFYPPTYTLNQTGCGGYYYKYGYHAGSRKGMKGNCTFWCLAHNYENTGVMLTNLIGDAKDFYRKYNGEKDGDGYIGDKVRQGDILVFSDSSCGHVIYVEQVDSDGTIHISESAYSSKAIYENKACIVYTLNKYVLTVGNKVSLRPQAPFTEVLVGVIHTGVAKSATTEDTTKKELQAKVDALNNKLERIKAIINE